MAAIKLAFVILGSVCVAHGNVVPETGIKQVDFSGSEFLDSEEKYQIAWEIDSTAGVIQVSVIAETLGYVGFGFSPNGAMTGADIFIAGVKEGTPYYSDWHGVGNTRPVEDASQDWTLQRGEESETHTKLVFSRKLNTCDDDDFEITDQTMHIIWAMGATDEITYHNDIKGTKSVNLFLASGDSFEPGNFQQLNIISNRQMGSEHTEYWCTIHELPKFNEAQHIVAFEPILENQNALLHTHHFIFYRCMAPQNQDPEEFFKPWLNHSGDFCYDQKNESFPFKNYCNGNMIYVWSKGGKRMVFPQNLGLPMPDVPGQKEYWAMEVHYDNPQMHQGKIFPTGGRMYYTDKLREIDAGLLVVDHKTRIQLTVPPNSENYVVTGHCSPFCTQALFPEDGINVFNNLLHAHLAGRKIKLRHFRKEQELEWLDKDDYYDFDYQQNKQLPRERKVMPGDQLTVECTYQTKDTAVTGGLSSKEEMCQAWFFYWPKQKLRGCGSVQDETEHMKLLGIDEFEIVGSSYPGGQETYRILKPDNLAGDYGDVVSNKLNWTTEFRGKFQQEKRYGVQQAACSTHLRKSVLADEELVSYPENMKEYVRNNGCDGGGEGSSTTPGDGDSSGVGKIQVGISLILLVFLQALQ